MNGTLYECNTGYPVSKETACAQNFQANRLQVIKVIYYTIGPENAILVSCPSFDIW